MQTDRARLFPSVARKAVFLLLFLCFSPPFVKSAEANGNGFKVYESIQARKSLLTSPQFLVIDDFNSGKFLNRRGAPWQTRAPKGGGLDLTLDKDDARNQHRGYSMKATFNMLPRERAVFQSFLERVDVSQARYFVLKVKLESRKEEFFSGRFRVGLTDWRHRTVSRDITAYIPRNHQGWGEVILPMKIFKTLDLDQLFTLRFQLIAQEKEIAGDVWVDEIAFYGFNDVAFESLRDNLSGYPSVVYDTRRKKKLLEIKDDRMLLKEIARDTWKHFENARDRDTFLIVDHIRMGDAPLAADYTSPTNISMDILSTIAAMDLHIITREEAVDRLRTVLSVLGRMRRFKGFFYNFYDTKKLAVTRSYISSVDSGWLAISLVVLRQAFPEEFAAQTTEFLDGFNFSEFLDPENNQLIIGFDVPEKDFGGYHYGMLVSEARATSFYAIGKGDLPEEHWWFLYRTPPDAWKWQTQKPQGPMVTQGGVDYVQGYYKHGKKRFVPSWGGSLFEYLMPTLVLKEKKLAPEGLGWNNRTVTKLHRDYALKEKKYPVWGISPAATRNGRRWSYGEFGVKSLSVKGYPDRGIVTPHVSFLALDSLPVSAIKNIRRLLDFQIYGEYGFYDSLDVRSKQANSQYLTLDQGMILVAIGNYLTGGAIQERFHQDAVVKKAEKLLKESFFNR